MNKQELIDEVSARSVQHHSAGVSKTVVAAVLDTLADIAGKQLTAAGAELTLPGIGKLKAVHKAGRTGRNPKTGEALKILPRTAVKFVVAKALKDAVA